jgi:hypothetical protein
VLKQKGLKQTGIKQDLVVLLSWQQAKLAAMQNCRVLNQNWNNIKMAQELMLNCTIIVQNKSKKNVTVTVEAVEV